MDERGAPAVDTTGLTDDDREQAILRLKDAYVSGSFDHDEFQRRTHVVLTTHSGYELAGVVSDLTVDRVETRGRPMRRGAAAVLAVSAAAAVMVVIGMMTSVAPPAGGEGICMSTGLSSDTLACPALSAEQVEINQRAEVARSAAWQAQDLAVDFEGPGGSALEVAASAAEASADRASRAAGQAQEIMAEALDQEPPAGAFDAALEEARAAAKEAVAALKDAEAAVDG